jgi:PEP-CTERM motif
MIKRSVLRIAVLGLLASLAFQTPSRADSFLIEVDETFTLSNLPSTTSTISSLTLQFSGLNGISNLSFLGAGFGGSGVVTPTLSGSAATGTVTLTFPTSVYLATGTVFFDTVTTTTDLTQLASQIKLVSETVVASANTQTYTPLSFSVVSVPEPTSMSLIGIGMAGFLTFRRWYKRFAIV